ncbi:TPA: hypothetical protein L5U90_003497 [Pseudomonas aeruginosa]|nr:hypothetical protein [Pseudomonas aeruginosa]
MKFLAAIGWQIFVIWLGLGVGFSMQVIERVKVPLPADQCQILSLQSDRQGGRCLFEARAEGNFDRTWTLSALSQSGSSIRVTQPTMLYDPSDWRMVGGTLSVSFLIFFVLAFSLAPLGFDLWHRGFIGHKRRGKVA